MTETLANGYSSEGTQRELSNEYQHDRIKMVFENICVLVFWTKVASALEGLMVKYGKNVVINKILNPLMLKYGKNSDDK